MAAPAQARFAFGALDRAASPEDADPGTLTEAHGLRWAGPPGAPRLEVPEGPTTLDAEAATGVPYLATWPLPDAADGSRRWLALTDRDVRRVLPGSGYASTVLHALPGAPDGTRKATFAGAGASGVLAVVAGAGLGTPEATLVVGDGPAGVFAAPLVAPRPPVLTFAATERADADGLPGGAGTYVVRVARRLLGGGWGPLSPPYAVTFGALADPAHSWTLAVRVARAAPDDDPATGAHPLAAGGWGVFVSLPDPEAAATGGPVYLVAEAEDRPHPAGATLAEVARTAERIVEGESPLDDHLLGFALRAGCVCDFNGRVVAGDVHRALTAPAAHEALREAAPAASAPSDVRVRLAVAYRTERGVRSVFGAEGFVPAGSAADVHGVHLQGADGTVGAPVGFDPHVIAVADPRAVRLTVQVHDGAGWVVAHDLPMRASTVAAAAYHFRDGGLDVTVPLGPPVLALATPEAALVEPAPALVAWTPPYAPAEFRASQTQPVGRSAPVVALLPHGRPASAGQFGEFPLLAWTSEAAYVLGVSEPDFVTAVVQTSPVLGLAGRYGACVADDGVAYALTTCGLYAFDPGPTPEPVSRPLGDALAPAPADAVGFSTGVDRREVWVASGGRVWTLSLRHGRWASLPRGRVHLGPFTANVTAAGALAAEDGASAPADFAVTTAPFTFGDPYTAKRLRRLALRQGPRADGLSATLYALQGDATEVAIAGGTLVPGATHSTLMTPYGHGRRFRLALAGAGPPGTALHSFEVAYEARRPTKAEY